MIYTKGVVSKGFTLIEIVMSLGIFLIGILGVLALFPVGFDSASRSSDLTKATIFAQGQMEKIKMAGYSAASAVGTETPFSDPRFKYTVAITTAGLPDNCKKVILSVSWDYKGNKHVENFVTFITSMGP